jgi:hypothetical protein
MTGSGERIDPPSASSITRSIRAAIPSCFFQIKEEKKKRKEKKDESMKGATL